MNSSVFDRSDLFARPRQAHLVGICGAGMRSLVKVLLRLGWHITGSDAAVSDTAMVDWQAQGVRVDRGHAAQQVPAACDVLIYSAAVPATNEERQAAATRGIPERSYVEMLAALMSVRRGISVAGTHGKSSTTAMIGSILRAAGADPLVILGAESVEHAISSPLSGLNHKTQFCVVESCEYREHFLQLRPQVICLTGIEADHFDCFPNVAAAVAAYGRFLDVLPADGVCIYNAADARAAELLQQRRIRTVSYAVTGDAAWTVANVESGGTAFDLIHNRQTLGTIRWNQWGAHQVANGLAAAATCGTLGLDATSIVQGLSQFRGLKRRLEWIGKRHDVSFFDDYAHHPTAISHVLQAVRQRVPAGNKLWCAFQPHQVSRTRGLLPEFAAALTLADEIFILPIFGARESASTEFVEVAQLLTLRVQQAAGKAQFVPQLNLLRTTLETLPAAGDVVVTLGAGDIDRIYHEFIRSIP